LCGGLGDILGKCLAVFVQFHCCLSVGVMD
jgi:hypothetical protein